MNDFQNFDLVVIGTGAVASAAAFSCREAGWSVAVIDSRPFGGTCELRGWERKKVLVGAGSLIEAMQRMNGKGLDGETARIDWLELMRFKRTVTDPVPYKREHEFHESGISTFHGVAHFTQPCTIQVQQDTLKTRHVLDAKGAKPQRLDIPGKDLLTTSEQFLNLDILPHRIMFIGYLKNMPMRRYAQPAEMAAAIAFLAGEKAAFITGQTLFVDGGASLRRL